MSTMGAIGRLAVRDVRRHPGRSLLTMMLVAVPVATAVFVSTWMHTGVETPAEAATRRMGRADALVMADPPPRDTRMADSIAHEPGWRVVSLRTAAGLADGSAGHGRLHVSILEVDAPDPVLRGLVSLDDGRWPAAAGEAAVSPRIRDAFGLRIGDTLTLIRPKLRVRIVGFEGHATQGDVIMAPALAPAGLESTRFLIDAAGPVTAAQRARYGDRLIVRDDLKRLVSSDTTRRDFAFLYLLIALGLAAFGLIISAALSVGSRRQMREIGVMRAGGASGAHAGQRVRLYALVVAVIGTAVGIAAGCGAAPLARGFVERRTGSVQGPLEVSTTDITLIALFAVVVVLVAAIGPARASARVPVLAALAGRRPLAPARGRVPLVGIVVFVAGCFATGWAVGSDSTDRPSLLILAVALTLAGVILCTPYLIGMLERVGSQVPGSRRLALRALARQRSRSGPMAAAIMAAGCLAIGGATYVLAIDHDERRKEVHVPASAGTVSFALQRLNVATGQRESVSCQETVALLHREVEPLMASPSTTCLSYRIGTHSNSDGAFSVVEPNDVAAIGGQAIARLLADGKIIVLDGSGRQILARGSGYEWLSPLRTRVVTLDSPAIDLAGTLGFEPVWVSTQTARALGMHIGPGQAIGTARQARRFSTGQARLIENLLGADLGADLSTATQDVWANLTSISPPLPDDYGRIAYAIILPVGIILSLLTVGVGLFLLNAENRDERTALVALGAGPDERRRQNAWQAGTLAFVAMALAVPPGLVLPYVVMRAASNELSYVVPWTVLAVLVIGVPAMAAVGAYVLTRPRVAAIPRRT